MYADGISIIDGFTREPADICYGVYYGDFHIIIVFKDKDDAVEYCKAHPSIQFHNTKIIVLPFNDSSYKF